MATPPVPLIEPAIKRAVVFVDGQNLFYGAREAFGYQYPNYEISQLAHQVSQSQNLKFVRNKDDVDVVFSQDQDLSEVADEIRAIARQQGWIRIGCAYPMSPTRTNRRGINGTQWIQIDRKTYDACIDPKDYRPPRK